MFFLFPAHISDYEENFSNKAANSQDPGQAEYLEGLLIAKKIEGENLILEIRSNGSTVSAIITPNTAIESESGAKLSYADIEILSVVKARGAAGEQGITADILTIIPPSLSVYDNPDLSVRFEYPDSWQPDTKYRELHGAYLRFLDQYGFFSLGALATQKDLLGMSAQDLKNEIRGSRGELVPEELKTMAMESEPVKTSINKKNALYLAEQGSACLISKYDPAINLEIGQENKQYDYLIVCTDQDHFGLLTLNLEFTGLAETSGSDGLNIKLNNLSQGSQIENPVVIDGEARGTWYFEGIFSVQVVDADGTVLGRANAEAIGDWMTEEYAPFNVKISYQQPETEKGRIIFSAANPSGIKQNEKTFFIDIKFSPAAAGSGNGGMEAQACITTGCSGEICSASETVSACEYKEEYGCLKHAKCEIQPDGACGWTKTTEYNNCIENLK